MNSRYFSTLFFLFVSTLTSYSQHNHDGHNHEIEHYHSGFEIGFSNGFVYNLTEKEGAYGLHVHFVKTIGRKGKYGLGLGYEAILDDHKHQAISAIFEYRATEHMLFNIAPGVTWLTTQPNSIKPSLHLEGIYAFEIGKIHLGPLVAVAFNTEDFHTSLGLHLAIEI